MPHMGEVLPVWLIILLEVLIFMFCCKKMAGRPSTSFWVLSAVTFLAYANPFIPSFWFSLTQYLPSLNAGYENVFSYADGMAWGRRYAWEGILLCVCLVCIVTYYMTGKTKRIYMRDGLLHILFLTHLIPFFLPLMQAASSVPGDFLFAFYAVRYRRKYIVPAIMNILCSYYGSYAYYSGGTKWGGGILYATFRLVFLIMIGYEQLTDSKGAQNESTDK